ncbi:MAG: cob(I)yrinic acid a,c-diamide adenosyltransferase [Bacteroidales bacterium]|nr:cob(I)yrinic acid a,c-diamide adenosyltransferase [Bacteroidales bacterium]
MNKGYIHVYTGDGKGKTTAALGLALRAAGHGMKTSIIQFMKGFSYGEISAIQNLPVIKVEQFGWPECIRREEVTEMHRERTVKGLDVARLRILSGNYEVVILDEILVAVWFGLVTEQQVLDIMECEPRTCELILTGRKATEQIMRCADLVTEMTCVKHYFDRGVTARRGIEY